MKKTRIILLVTTIVLLIGAIIGITVSATESTPTPEIIGKNIRYGADLKLCIAVDGDALGAGKEVIVNFYDADPATGASPVDTATATYTDTSDKSKYNLDSDNTYIAVSNYGISAISYGQIFYITAECDGEVSEVLEYSAVEYFLERLYEDADTISAIQKKHYENAIAYGSTAQLVTGDTKTNVADYLYVGAKGGEVFIDGKSVGEGAIVLKGDKFSLKPASALTAGYAPLWKDPTGSTIKGTSEITASVSGMYGYTLIPMLTFDGMNDVPVTISSSSSAFTTFGSDYANYNKVFKIYNGASTKNPPLTSIINEKLVINSDDGSDYIKIHPTYTETGYNHTVFEADITFNCNTGNVTFDLLTSDDYAAVRFNLFSYNMSTGYFSMKATNSSGGNGHAIDAYLDTTGDKAHTLNLKVDHYKLDGDILVAFWLNGTLKYIIDSRLATNETTGNIDSKNTDGVFLSGTRYYPYNGAAAGKETVKTDFSQFCLNTNSSFSGSITFDNIMFTQTVTNEAPDYNTTRK